MRAGPVPDVYARPANGLVPPATGRIGGLRSCPGRASAKAGSITAPTASCPSSPTISAGKLRDRLSLESQAQAFPRLPSSWCFEPAHLTGAFIKTQSETQGFRLRPFLQTPGAWGLEVFWLPHKSVNTLLIYLRHWDKSGEIPAAPTLMCSSFGAFSVTSEVIDALG